MEKKELQVAELAKQENKKMNKMVFVGGAMALLGSNAFATSAPAGSTFSNDDSFGILASTFGNWLQGNLGKLLALLGFAGTFIVYMMTHKGSVLFIGIIISLIAGGMVGISQTFFTAGSAFNN